MEETVDVYSIAREIQGKTGSLTEALNQFKEYREQVPSLVEIAKNITGDLRQYQEKKLRGRWIQRHRIEDYWDKKKIISFDTLMRQLGFYQYERTPYGLIIPIKKATFINTGRNLYTLLGGAIREGRDIPICLRAGFATLLNFLDKFVTASFQKNPFLELSEKIDQRVHFIKGIK